MSNPYVNDIVVSGSNLLASAYNKVYRSRDSGTTWTLLNTRFDTTSYKVNDLFVWQGMVYAATPRGIYRSLDSGTTWSKSGLGLQTRYISTLTSGQDYLFATGDTAWVSSDSGKTWRYLQTDPDVMLRGIHLIGGVLYAATADEFYRSTDGGTIWKFSDYPSNSRSPLEYVPFGGSVFATTLHTPVYSRDKGDTWTAIEVDAATSPWVLTLQPTNTVLYAGTYEDGVYESDASGLSWSFSGIPNGKISTMAILGDRLFAAEDADWMYWTRLPPGTSLKPRAGSPQRNAFVHRDAAGNWTLELHQERPSAIHITQVELSGQVRSLWSGQTESGDHSIPLKTPLGQQGVSLLQIRFEDGRSLSIPAVTQPW